MAIFVGEALPIIIMGGVLEVSKIAVTVWLHNNWERAPRTLKAYMTSAVVILMIITSLGIFGFLSKSHLEHGVTTGDVSAKVEIFDDKIKTLKSNIESNKNALAQMDLAVNQLVGRTDDAKGIERSLQVRRSQAKERAKIQAEIEDFQTQIAKLNEEKAPVAKQLRKATADVGPIQYVAALIYGNKTDEGMMESAVRWIIILLVSVFDPLAVVMIIAANKSLAWIAVDKARKREEKQMARLAELEAKHAELLNEEQFELKMAQLKKEEDNIKHSGNLVVPDSESITKTVDTDNNDVNILDLPQHAYLKKKWKWMKCKAPLVPTLNLVSADESINRVNLSPDGYIEYQDSADWDWDKCNRIMKEYPEGSELFERAYARKGELNADAFNEKITNMFADEEPYQTWSVIEEPKVVLDYEEPLEEDTGILVPKELLEETENDLANAVLLISDLQTQIETLKKDKEENDRQYNSIGNVDNTTDIDDSSDDNLTETEKEVKSIDGIETTPKSTEEYELIQNTNGEVIGINPTLVSMPDLSIHNESTGDVGFGVEFPKDPGKGDLFLRVDYFPNRLYKWNSQKWIEVDKAITDTYAYDEEYLKHLIEKLRTGEYDYDLLTVIEQDQISRFLNDK